MYQDRPMHFQPAPQKYQEIPSYDSQKYQENENPDKINLEVLNKLTEDESRKVVC